MTPSGKTANSIPKSVGSGKVTWKICNGRPPHCKSNRTETGAFSSAFHRSDQDDDMTFSMVDENANDLNGEGEDVRVKGRSVGDALAERRILGFIDTHGSFSPSSDDPLP